jgi:hypothetical protein
MFMSCAHVDIEWTNCSVDMDFLSHVLSTCVHEMSNAHVVWTPMIVPSTSCRTRWSVWQDSSSQWRTSSHETAEEEGGGEEEERACKFCVNIFLDHVFDDWFCFLLLDGMWIGPEEFNAPATGISNLCGNDNNNNSELFLPPSRSQLLLHLSFDDEIRWDQPKA